jgi:hypothetical protein
MEHFGVVMILDFAKVVQIVEVKRKPKRRTFHLFYGKLDNLKFDLYWWVWRFGTPFMHYFVKKDRNLLSHKFFLFQSILDK